MRLVIDARPIQDHFPGIGRYLYNLIDALCPQLDGDVMAVTCATASNRHYDLSALTRHHNLTLIPTEIPVFHWREQTQLPGILESLQPDVVHFPYNVRPFFTQLPSILTLYDIIPRRYPQYFTYLNRLRIELVQRLALRSSHAYVAISQTTANDFEDAYHIPAQAITITPLAPDPIFRPQSQQAIAAVHHRLGLPDHYILYVGSNKPHKNVPRLVQAWGEISPHAPGVSLVIAGSWDRRYPEAMRLRDSLTMRDSIHFLGPIANADLPALYSGADLFVFPSLYEGFGLPVAEAMACGLAVACSDIASLIEIVGEAAVVFDPTSSEALAATVIRLWQHSSLRQELRVKGLEQVSQFTWAKTARATLAAYRGLVAQ